MTKDTDRHSEPVVTVAHTPLSPEERAPIEAKNAARQFDRMIEVLDDYLDRRKKGDATFQLRTSLLMELNRIAVDQLIANPGGYRQTPMTISSPSGVVKHQPPDWQDVPRWVDEMCEYVNLNRNATAIHLSAYLLWRVNWIHPFSDGNGRTARAISYLILCVRFQQRLPGDRTMPEFISDEKAPYYAGLEAADKVYKKDGTVDVSQLERYLQQLLTEQVLRAANTGAAEVARPAPPPKRDVDQIAEALGGLTAATRANAEAKSTPWIIAAGGLLAAVVAGGFAISRCGKEARCTPNAQTACRCANGQNGVQSCDAAGVTYSLCDCATAPASSAAGSDAASGTATGTKQGTGAGAGSSTSN